MLLIMAEFLIQYNNCLILTPSAVYPVQMHLNILLGIFSYFNKVGETYFSNWFPLTWLYTFIKSSLFVLRKI